GAYLLDTIICTVIAFGVGFLIGLTMHPRSASDEFSQQLIYQAIGFLIKMVYEVGFLTRFSATPGKMIAGIKVTDGAGHPIRFGLACGRYLSKALSCLTFGVGYILAAFDEEKRALHDQICNTRVVFRYVGP